MKPPIPTEEQEQAALAEYLNMVIGPDKWFHVPNEGKSHVAYRVKQRKMGLKSGVPDVIIVRRPPLYPDSLGAAIELKRRKGGIVSDNQARWHKSMKAEGWLVSVCYGADDAIRQLREWGYAKSRTPNSKGKPCPERGARCRGNIIWTENTWAYHRATVW
jgi:hypothetical protein